MFWGVFLGGGGGGVARHPPRQSVNRIVPFTLFVLINSNIDRYDPFSSGNVIRVFSTFVNRDDGSSKGEGMVFLKLIFDQSGWNQPPSPPYDDRRKRVDFNQTEFRPTIQNIGHTGTRIRTLILPSIIVMQSHR